MRNLHAVQTAFLKWLRKWNDVEQSYILAGCALAVIRTLQLVEPTDYAPDRIQAYVDALDPESALNVKRSWEVFAQWAAKEGHLLEVPAMIPVPWQQRLEEEKRKEREEEKRKKREETERKRKEREEEKRKKREEERGKRKEQREEMGRKKEETPAIVTEFSQWLATGSLSFSTQAGYIGGLLRVIRAVGEENLAKQEEVERYLKTLTAPGTAVATRGAMSTFYKWKGIERETRAQNRSEHSDLLAGFKVWLSEKGMSPSTVQTYKGAVGRVLNAVEAGEPLNEGVARHFQRKDIYPTDRTGWAAFARWLAEVHYVEVYVPTDKRNTLKDQAETPPLEVCRVLRKLHRVIGVPWTELSLFQWSDVRVQSSSEEDWLFPPEMTHSTLDELPDSWEDKVSLQSRKEQNVKWIIPRSSLNVLFTYAQPKGVPEVPLIPTTPGSLVPAPQEDLEKFSKRRR